MKQKLDDWFTWSNQSFLQAGSRTFVEVHCDGFYRIWFEGGTAVGHADDYDSAKRAAKRFASEWYDVSGVTCP